MEPQWPGPYVVKKCVCVCLDASQVSPERIHGTHTALYTILCFGWGSASTLSAPAENATFYSEPRHEIWGCQDQTACGESVRADLRGPTPPRLPTPPVHMRLGTHGHVGDAASYGQRRRAGRAVAQPGAGTGLARGAREYALPLSPERQLGTLRRRRPGWSARARVGLLCFLCGRQEGRHRCGPAAA